MNGNYRTNIRCESRIDISFGRLTMYPFFPFKVVIFTNYIFTYRNARGDIHYISLQFHGCEINTMTMKISYLSTLVSAVSKKMHIITRE